jgi:hypothetical protein
VGKRFIFLFSALYSQNAFGMMRPAFRHIIQASGGIPERPKGADCKSAVIDFEGSNPSPATIAFPIAYIVISSRFNP